MNRMARILTSVSAMTLTVALAATQIQAEVENLGLPQSSPERLDLLAETEANRAQIVSTIVERLRPEAEANGFAGWEPELTTLLMNTRVERLLDAQSADGYKGVVAAATHYTPDLAPLPFAGFGSPAENVGNISAADGTSGLSFRPITPCRIVDTRNVFKPLLAGEDRAFHVDDSAAAGTIAGQGGDCTAVAPTDMAGIAVNITLVRPPAPGFITIYPEGDLRPNASVINFIPQQILANSSVVKTPIASGADFRLYSLTSTQVVVDLLGYFVPHDMVIESTINPYTAGFDFYSPFCPAGYSYASAERAWAIGNTDVWFWSFGKDGSNDRARCRGFVNRGGATSNVTCAAVCMR